MLLQKSPAALPFRVPCVRVCLSVSPPWTGKLSGWSWGQRVPPVDHLSVISDALTHLLFGVASTLFHPDSPEPPCHMSHL